MKEEVSLFFSLFPFPFFTFAIETGEKQHELNIRLDATIAHISSVPIGEALLQLLVTQFKAPITMIPAKLLFQ